MVGILQNTTALAASRQLSLTTAGLGRSLERLTTGKRINHASDDATGMVLGNTAEAAARAAWESVKGQQVIYFTAQAWDATLEEVTNSAYRMAELEGGGNESSTEYTTIQATATDLLTLAEGGVLGLESVGGPIALRSMPPPDPFAEPFTLFSGDILSKAEGFRQRLAAIMSSAQSSANLAGINAESKLAISDAWRGADIGAEMANLTKYQIMMQAGTSALNKANQSTQSLLGLFK